MALFFEKLKKNSLAVMFNALSTLICRVPFPVGGDFIGYYQLLVEVNQLILEDKEGSRQQE